MPAPTSNWNHSPLWLKSMQMPAIRTRVGELSRLLTTRPKNRLRLKILEVEEDLKSGNESSQSAGRDLLVFAGHARAHWENPGTPLLASVWVTTLLQALHADSCFFAVFDSKLRYSNSLHIIVKGL